LVGRVLVRGEGRWGRRSGGGPVWRRARGRGLEAEGRRRGRKKKGEKKKEKREKKKEKR
jgi:hypothetical protein